MGRPWTPYDDLMVMRYYPGHGARWSGWGEVLPHRSRAAIKTHAHALGVFCGTRHGGRTGKRPPAPPRASSSRPAPRRLARACGGCRHFKPSANARTEFGRCLSAKLAAQLGGTFMTISSRDAGECAGYVAAPSGRGARHGR